MDFNLLDEKWIPVVRRDGLADRVGIRDALAQAHRIRQIAAPNPLDEMALLRFLLAVLHWCRGAYDAPGGGTIPAEWLSRLDAGKDLFRLFGDGGRFYQDAAALRLRPATELLHEVPTGHNFWHPRHSEDGSTGLCPACCALGLLRLPLFCESGTPGMRTGINGPPPVYAMRLGSSLWDTLRGNLLDVPLGTPAWERLETCRAPDRDVPLLAGLTAPARLVWLHEPCGPPGACAGCGAREPALVRQCGFQPAGTLKSDRWRDPHVLYRGAKQKAVKARPTGGWFRLDRPWGDAMARMAEDGWLERAAGASLLLVAFVTDNMKYVDAWRLLVRLPPKSAPNPVSTAAMIERWHKEGRRVERAAGRLSGSGLGAAAVAGIRPTVERALAPRIGEVLSDGDWERAAADYRRPMDAIARSLFPGCTTEAELGRRRLASIRPDMRPEEGD